MTTRFFRVECDKCGDSYETTKRTLPFVCLECESAKFFQEAIAPESEPVECNFCNAGPEPETESEPEGDACEGSSVEATTDLIAALESDIERQKKLVTFLEARGDALLARATEAEKALGRVATSSLEFMEESLGKILSLKKRIVALETELWDEKEAHGETRKTATRHYYENMETFDDNRRLIDRGFWARVFNKV